MVDKSRSRKEGGAGLGMTLCSKIVEVHGAKWQIDSVPGKGTEIKIFFRKRTEGVKPKSGEVQKDGK